ncbi:hypothetical protein [Spirillospora sp. NBC_01491]|uniref:hypothetical protein n=1 Tax=Spirillospora sp. NBC_01491 TaxID=2976007 RepID=UPI002E34BD21|nr:hypothetical protein [Spirillospora sp. NBC_01491]
MNTAARERAVRSRAVRARAGRAGAAFGALAVAGTPMLLAAPPASAASAADQKIIFTVTDPRIGESSGLATSRRHKGVVYTHNDSGGRPEIFALGPDGRTRAVLTLAGAGARDWEAMAIGADERGRPAIYVADIGDNLGGAWPYVTVYRIPEPAVMRTQTLRATAFRIKYEDGPRNAEAMMINPTTNRLYIASKLFSGKLYEGPARLSTKGFNTMREVGDAPAIATDAAFAPDGRSYVIRTYFGARAYAVGADGRPGPSLRSVSLPSQKQGESVTYTADGRSLLVGSEGTNQPVYQVSLPEKARPAASPSPKAAGDDNADQGHREGKGPRVGLFLVLAIAAVVGYGVMRRRA